MEKLDKMNVTQLVAVRDILRDGLQEKANKLLDVTKTKEKLEAVENRLRTLTYAH